ncbi:MAG: hypothetical protein WDZ79_02145 [Candidatus Paceibacterota bacterium]
MPSIQTYESDAHETVQKRSSALSRAERARLRKGATHRAEEQRSSASLLVFYTSLVLVTAGLVALLVVGYFVFVAPDEGGGDISYQRLISSQNITPIETRERTREGILANIKREMDELSQQSGGTVAVFPLIAGPESTGQIPAEAFIRLVGPSAPAALGRNLSNEYVVGAFTADREPFIILTTSSYEQTYPAMLEWEREIARDLAGIITSVPHPQTTLADDLIVDNRDARVLLDENGDQVVAYMFIDAGTIAIAQNERVLRRVMTTYRNTQRL